MQQVIAVCLFVLAFCVGLALVGYRLRGRHRRGAVAMRLLVGVPLLVVYICGVLHFTILGRQVGATRMAKLELFWSHRESLALVADGLSVTNLGLLVEILLNVLLFVPFGALLPFMAPCLLARGRALRGAGTVGLLAGGCSLAIELVQWRFRLGLFEFDDVMDNALGAVMGYAVYSLVCWRPWSRLGKAR